MESTPGHLVTGCKLLCIFLLLTFSLDVNTADVGVDSLADIFSEGYDTSPDDSISFIKRKYLWFGPRLGRKKRTATYDAQVDKTLDDETITEVIRESPWALVPIRAYARNTLSFTPRLGRNLEEDIDHSQLIRFGRQRKLLPFSPRLGRDLTANHNAEAH